MQIRSATRCFPTSGLDVFRHNPQALFDLGDRPYSYESLVAAYNKGQKVFQKKMFFDKLPPATEEGGNGQ